MDYDVVHALDRFSGHHPTFEHAVKAYVTASEPIFIAIVVLLFLWIGSRYRWIARAAAVSAALSAGIALLIAHFVAQAVDRPRPFIAHPGTIHDFLSHAADASFPSDHATGAFAIAMAVFLWRRRWGAVLFVLAIALSIGRVFLGVHYLSDVLAGAALGALVALVLSLPPLRRVIERITTLLAAVLDGAVGRVTGRTRPAIGK
jgi:undecaprenyl-diphosphatase